MKEDDISKRKIKVYILASPHPQFDEILDFPPKGIEYIINRVKTKYHSWFTEHKIMLHGFLMNLLPIPRMTRTNTNADLIHSTRGVLQIKPKKPWIVDCESGEIFTSFNWKALKNPIVKRIITKSLSSKKCKKILPQSEAANKNLHRAIDCSKFEDKIEVLYLAMRPCEKKKINRKDNKVVLSFIGRGFYGKGSHDLLKAYEILTQKYKNLELKFKGDEFPENYKHLEKLPGLKLIKGFFPRDKLFDEMYLSSDIFVLPTHQDNYGVVFLEAMSAGLPVVGTENMTVSELITNGKNGFLIKSPYSWENYIPYGKEKELLRDWQRIHPEIVKKLVEKLSILIENKKLREKMGKESRRMIEKGHLSIKERNKKLRRIYEEVLTK